jgi:hypothetical protein
LVDDPHAHGPARQLQRRDDARRSSTDDENGKLHRRSLASSPSAVDRLTMFAASLGRRRSLLRG